MTLYVCGERDARVHSVALQHFVDAVEAQAQQSNVDGSKNDAAEIAIFSTISQQVA